MRAFLALGSNRPSPTGGPAATLDWAMRALAGLPGVAVLGTSPIYRTRAEGPPQPDYANAVIEVETDLPASLLLGAAQALEQAMGREPQPAGANLPRPLDVDLLLFGDAVMTGPRLTLPHPRLHRRRFVLVPLADLAPDLHHPALGARVGELLARLPDQGEVTPWEAPERGASR